MKPFLLLLVIALCHPAAALPVLTRGPYLQKSRSSSVTVKWRTDVAARGTVRFGLVANDLTQSVVETAAVTEHELPLSGLPPGTKIFYRVEADGTVLSTPADCFFTTPPATGATAPIRFWVLGDSGTANAGAAAVRDAYATAIHSSASPAQFMMMLGDNAYAVGSDAEYQQAVFNVYPALLRQLPLWPTIGNHETYAVGGGLDMPYLNIFSLPAAGECGGVASGTEYYYAFNHGNVHFVCLDSMVSSRASNGAMAQWLQADLQANLLPWTVAFFHHPPYTKGSHNSDLETELVQMRTNLLPILEAYGVDLVLTGHSHSYERSYLLDGHYGNSDTLGPANLKSSASGNPATTGAYLKSTAGASAHEGAVYIVNGSSGQIGGGALNHPAMALSLNQLGSLVVDVAGNRMDVRFLRETGAFDDAFAIVKGTAAPAAPTGLVALATGTTSVQLFWNDNSGDEHEFLLYRSLDGITFDQVAVVAENSFNAVVSALAPNTAYFFTLKSSNGAVASASSNVVSITTPGANPTLTALEIWRFRHFGTIAETAVTADNADPDGDGHDNLAEYALGTRPNRISSSPTIASGVLPTGELQITFQRQALPEVTYIVESTPSLATPNWTPLFTSTGAANTAGLVTVTSSTAPGFIRLRITR